MTAINALLVSHGSGLGGGERVMLEMVEGLDRALVRPTIVVPEEGPLAARARDMDISTIVSPAPWWLPFDDSDEPSYLFRRYWEQSPQFVRPLVRVIADRRIDVVYSAGSLILHAALAAHIARKPHLQHMQDLLGYPHLGLRMPFHSARLAYHLLGRFSTLVVCVGRTSLEDIGDAIPSAKCRIVPLGLRPAARPAEPMPLGPADAQAVRVGVIGAVDRRKGKDIIGAIVQRVCAEAPDVHVYWAGGGESHVLERLTAEGVVNGQPHLHFLGYTEQVPDFIASMDFLLHPARNETFPRVLLEGAAAARAIVATTSGGGQEIVQHGVTGLLAPVDDVAAIAAAVVSLARDPATRARMGAAARVYASGFDIGRFQAGMQQALLDAHRRGPAIRSAAAARLASELMALPARIAPPLRRWTTREA